LTAVKNISFTVPAGKILAFLGPNGTDKSTTIKILTTLLKPTRGEIMLLTCGIDAFRALLIKTTHFGLATDLIVLSSIIILFLLVGSYSFSKMQV